MLAAYLPTILTGLVAIAAVMAYIKKKDTPFLLMMVGFVLQFLIVLVPMIFPGLMVLGIIGWLGYLAILIGLLMVQSD